MAWELLTTGGGLFRADLNGGDPDGASLSRLLEAALRWRGKGHVGLGTFPGAAAASAHGDIAVAQADGRVVVQRVTEDQRFVVVGAATTLEAAVEILLTVVAEQLIHPIVHQGVRRRSPPRLQVVQQGVRGGAPDD